MIENEKKMQREAFLLTCVVQNASRLEVLRFNELPEVERRKAQNYELHKEHKANCVLFRGVDGRHQRDSEPLDWHFDHTHDYCNNVQEQNCSKYTRSLVCENAVIVWKAHHLWAVTRQQKEHRPRHNYTKRRDPLVTFHWCMRALGYDCCENKESNSESRKENAGCKPQKRTIDWKHTRAVAQVLGFHFVKTKKTQKSHHGCFILETACGCVKSDLTRHTNRQAITTIEPTI
jgi:hypothetical protein